MTVFGYPVDWDWDDCSGYVPPNSDLARSGTTVDGLPRPPTSTTAITVSPPNGRQS